MRHPAQIHPEARNLMFMRGELGGGASIGRQGDRSRRLFLIGVKSDMLIRMVALTNVSFVARTGQSQVRAFWFLMLRDVWDIIPSYTTAVRPCSLVLAAPSLHSTVGQRRAALFCNEAAHIGPAVSAQAGRCGGDAAAPHEHDLNK